MQKDHSAFPEVETVCKEYIANSICWDCSSAVTLSGGVLWEAQLLFGSGGKEERKFKRGGDGLGSEGGPVGKPQPLVKKAAARGMLGWLSWLDIQLLV